MEYTGVLGFVTVIEGGLIFDGGLPLFNPAGFT
jgi:hypothetical protein